jgi:transposase-like protein
MGRGKHWKQEEKMAIVLEGLQGKAVKDVCAKYGVAETQYYRWRDQAFEGMKEALADKRRRENRNTHEAERDRLLKVIGEQAAALDLQKKLSEVWLGERS